MHSPWWCVPFLTASMLVAVVAVAHVLALQGQAAEARGGAGVKPVVRVRAARARLG